jgi:hypothetical protein
MASVTKVKNVGKGEAIFRFFTGVILIILVFFISGVFRWVIGLLGVVVILTALFGYWPWKGFMLKVFSKEDERI